MTDPLRQLSSAGVAVWLDDLSRARLVTGNLADLVRDRSLVGVTTNPTIFQTAISASPLYDGQLRDLAVRGVDVGEAIRSLTTTDVRAACDVLRPVYDATGGVDGSRSRSTPGSVATPKRQSPRPERCGGGSTDPTSTSRSPRRSKGFPRSLSASPKRSAST